LNNKYPQFLAKISSKKQTPKAWKTRKKILFTQQFSHGRYKNSKTKRKKKLTAPEYFGGEIDDRTAEGLAGRLLSRLFASTIADLGLDLGGGAPWCFY